MSACWLTTKYESTHSIESQKNHHEKVLHPREKLLWKLTSPRHTSYAWLLVKTFLSFLGLKPIYRVRAVLDVWQLCHSCNGLVRRHAIGGSVVYIGLIWSLKVCHHPRQNVLLLLDIA